MSPGLFIFGLWMLLIIGFGGSVLRDWLRKRSERRQYLQRGFEVKLTTGETSVLRERENDHG